MFIAHYENTMRNARPAPPVEREVVRTIQQIRAEKRREAEAARRRQIEAWAARAAAERQEAENEAELVRTLAAYRCIVVRGTGPKEPARDIVAKVAALHGMTASEVISARRDRKTVEARFDAIKAVADARPDLSLPQIGRIFERDHTSILHALRKRGGRVPSSTAASERTA